MNGTIGLPSPVSLMMYGVNPVFFPLFLILHIIGMAAIGIGIFLFVAWFVRTWKPAQLLSRGWTLLGTGIVICLLSMFFLSDNGYEWYRSPFGMIPARLATMMGYPSTLGEQDTELKAEEALGYDLYSQFRASKVTCTTLSDQLVGADGEEEMHVAIGKRFTGCAPQTTGGASSAS